MDDSIFWATLIDFAENSKEAEAEAEVDGVPLLETGRTDEDCTPVC